MDLAEVVIWNKIQGEAGLEIKEEVQTLVVLMEILVDSMEMVFSIVEILNSLVVLVEEVAEETLLVKFVLNQIIQLLIAESSSIGIFNSHWILDQCGFYI